MHERKGKYAVNNERERETSMTIDKQNKPVYTMMILIGVGHLINDTMQAVVPAMFPLLREDLGLTFTQLGLISFVLNMFASVLQPVVGFVTDKKPMPFALPIGMVSSFIGLVLLIIAPSYTMILVAVLFFGFGSAIFHPEGSRVSFMAAGNKRGLAQSIYQVGGNSGQALAPLISAFLILPFGMYGASVILILAAVGIFILSKISLWYRQQLEEEKLAKVKKMLVSSLPPLTKKQIGIALALLITIIFARSFYVINMTNYYVFYLVDNYSLSIEVGQILIFIFMAMGVVGTYLGGGWSDKYGRKNIILLSVVAPIPLCLILPHVPLWAVVVLLVIIGGLIMISFSVLVVYAQELVPSKIGTMAGLTVGLAFGMGAIGSIVIGRLIDIRGIDWTIQIVSYLSLLMLVALFLPRDNGKTA